MSAPRRLHARSAGQTMMFVIMTLVVLAFVAFLVFDVHKILHLKSRSRVAGDAAALAAARWQGQSLNLIGDLNVAQAIAISEALLRGEEDFADTLALGDLQTRVSFVGPMMGVVAAQQAAKHNGMFVNPRFTQEFRDHAATVRTDYNIRFPSAYTPDGAATSWDDYADMIEAIASQGLAVAVDNPHYYVDYTGSHLLLNPSFYDAISTRSWCWFLSNAYDELQTYTSWLDWPPLPVIVDPSPINSEFFSLGISRVTTLSRLPGLQGSGDLAEVIRRLADLAEQDIPSEVAEQEAHWATYRPARWSSWTGRIGPGFPWAGEIRGEHNYTGADAAVRLENRSARLGRAATSDVVEWTAAGKPFGHLDTDDGRDRPNRFGLVLPAFREVNLIPVDTSSAPAGGTRPGWAEFVRVYLPLYMQYGPYALPSGNWYAQQLVTWENPVFRMEGVQWLMVNRQDCYRRPSGPGGGGGSGGTRRAH